MNRNRGNEVTMDKPRRATLYHDLVERVVAALETKDHFTADHSLRVSDMAEQACRSLGLTDEQTEMIHMAAHVHDIGKIGVPDAVLTKPGTLNDEEWASIRQHPRIGAEILGQAAELSEIAGIVRHHHEKWNGQGYPDGLKEYEIPLGSRIIAVCDSIDSMLSERPYRRPLSQQACREEILRNSGVMYDPDIVERIVRDWDIVVTPYCT